MFHSECFQYGNLSLCCLSNGTMKIETSNLGARLYRVYVPNKYGEYHNVILSDDDLQKMSCDPYCFGATVGPVAGRIKNGRWQQYQLEQNQAPHCLHSGNLGLQNQYFEFLGVKTTDEYIEASYTYTDHQTGLPEVCITVYYRLTNNNELVIIYEGQAAEDTLFNPANHAYFNLSGCHQSIRDHKLYLNAKGRLELDETCLPTGKIKTEEVDYDFSKLVSLSERIPFGLDDCFILNNDSQKMVALTLQHQESGRKMNIYTERDSIILFTGTNMIDDKRKINGGPLISEAGLAIECQEVPDACHNHLSNIKLKKGEKRTIKTTYEFLVIE